MSHVAHLNESCRTHVAHLNASCRTFGWVMWYTRVRATCLWMSHVALMSHIWKSHVIYKSATGLWMSHVIYKKQHIWMSHVALVSHIWMSHVAHLDESCRTFGRVTSCTRVHCNALQHLFLLGSQRNGGHQCKLQLRMLLSTFFEGRNVYTYIYVYMCIYMYIYVYV